MALFTLKAMKEQKLNRKKAKDNLLFFLRIIGEKEKAREFQQEYPKEKTNAKVMVGWFTEHLWVIEFMNRVIEATEDPYSLYYLHLPFKDLFECIQESMRLSSFRGRERLYCSVDLSTEDLSIFRDGVKVYLFGFLAL